MVLPRKILLIGYKTWLFPSLILLLLASQCNAPPTPPLPITPSGPVVPVALLTPNEGELATFGRILRNGSQMAFEAWNNRGGTLDHRIEWVNYDTECQFDSAQQAVQRAIDDGIKFIIGPLCSQAAIAAAEQIESDDVLMISPTATHPLVTVNGQGQTRPRVFRISHAYPAQGQAAARFAHNQLEAGKAAIFTNLSDDYSRTLTDAFAQHFSQLGGEIVFEATYGPGDNDFEERLMAIRNSGAEVVYLPAPVEVVNRVAGQLNELNSSTISPLPEVMPILLGSDSWESPELDLEATTGSYFTTHFALSEADLPAQTWAEAYRSTYATEPSTLAVLGYDAAQLMLAAIQQAGTFDPTVVAKILEQNTFRGVTGEISFDSQHNPIKPVPIMQIKDGQIMGPFQP